MWDGVFGKSVIIQWFYDQIVLLWAAVTGGDPPDLSSKITVPDTFTNGNFATYNSTTNKAEDTGKNIGSFVEDAIYVHTDNNYTDEDKAKVDALGETSSCYETHVKDTNKSASYTVAMPAGSALLYINAQHVSGTPLLTVGTTEGGDQILPETEITDNDPLIQPINKGFESATTIYITISGGTININYIYYENHFVV